MSELIWLTTAQAGKHTGRHAVTVRKALEAGELHGSQNKPGGTWRIHIECLDAWQWGKPCAHGVGGKSDAA